MLMTLFIVVSLIEKRCSYIHIYADKNTGEVFKMMIQANKCLNVFLGKQSQKLLTKFDNYTIIESRSN